MSQHMEALEKANRTRLDRSAIKREIAAKSKEEGREQITKLIMNPGSLWRSARLDYILAIPRRSGPRFVSKMLNSGRHPLNPRKQLGTLTTRQRVELTIAIRKAKG